MSTAEKIVKEYLDRGYSLESLRLLAESREQPLGAEMLVVIDGLDGGVEMVACEEDSGPCETAAYPVAADDERGIFYVSDNGEDVPGESRGIDFDVMAGTADALMDADKEESVADIFIGETNGSEKPGPGPDASAVSAALAGREDAGIWSRLWMRVATAATPALARRPDWDDGENETPAATEGTASEAVCEAINEESAASEVIGESVAETLVFEEPVAQTEDNPADEERDISEERNESAEESHVDETGELEECSPLETVAMKGADAEISAQSEMSADYLPGSVSELYEGPDALTREIIEEEKSRLADALMALNENAVIEDALDESVAQATEENNRDAAPEARGEEQGEQATESVPEAQGSVLSNAAVGDDAEDKKKARRERRRARSRKKKERAADLSGSGESAPEIVLTRSEGSVSLSAEREGETREFGLAVENAEAASAEEKDDREIASSESMLPVRREDCPVAEEEREERAAPRMSEPMGLLTPNDLIEDDSQLLGETRSMPVENAEIGAKSEDEDEGSVASLSLMDAGKTPESCAVTEGSAEGVAELCAPAATTGEEAARPQMEAEPGDYLMIIANGGVDPARVAALLTADGEDSAVAETAGEERCEEVDGGNNVILFNEMFPIFAGVGAEEEEQEEEDAFLPARAYLRMLPSVQMDEGETAENDIGAVDEAEDVAPATLPLLGSAEPLLLMNQFELEEEPLASEERSCIFAALPEPEATPELAMPDDYLGADARAGVVRALYGEPSLDDMLVWDEVVAADTTHVIISLEPDPAPDDAMEREAVALTEMEEEYQSRLDGFALRLLEAQTASATVETKVREKKAELEAKDAVLEEMKKRIADAEECERQLTGQLEQARGETLERDREIGYLKGMREEHGRLFNEFEDLRKAYNEVVTDVMPGLQKERDDLALTVERQCGHERKLRRSLGSARKRLAVGYSLGAAAALMLIALPVANWLRSPGADKDLAVDHQMVTELRQNLQNEVDQNISFRQKINELENKVGTARNEIAQLQGKNLELTRIRQQQQMQPQSDLAVFKPTESGTAGIPTRASTMALQATPSSGGRLHVNEVRDPAGSIDQVLSDNRQRVETPQASQMASAVRPQQQAIPLRSISRSDNRNGQAGTASTLRPERAQASTASAAQINSSSKPAQRAAQPTVKARAGEVLATVRETEGVAQVVYRELGTWDPEVIAWVVRENKIRSDRRGNPIIHPKQVLRLPKEGRVGQAASAGKRR